MLDRRHPRPRPAPPCSVELVVETDAARRRRAARPARVVEPRPLAARRARAARRRRPPPAETAPGPRARSTPGTRSTSSSSAPRTASRARGRSPSPRAPARSYNPLFIYGPAGLGKTHLLHAIGHHVRTVFRNKRVRYVSTESFMNEFVDAIRAKSDAELQAPLPRPRRAADRRHPVPRAHAGAPGGVLPHVQPAPRRGRPDRHLVRPAAEVDREPRGPPAHAASSGASSPTSSRPSSRPASPSSARRPSPSTSAASPRGARPSSPPTSATTSASSRAPSSGSPRTRASTAPSSPRRSPARSSPTCCRPPRPRAITPDLILDETAKMFGWHRRRPLRQEPAAARSSPPARSACT